MDVIEKVIMPVGTVGDQHQDLLEVLHRGGTVCTNFRIEVMGCNTLHPAVVGGPV